MFKKEHPVLYLKLKTETIRPPSVDVRRGFNGGTCTPKFKNLVFVYLLNGFDGVLLVVGRFKKSLPLLKIHKFFQTPSKIHEHEHAFVPLMLKLDLFWGLYKRTQAAALDAYFGGTTVDKVTQ